MSTQKDIHIKIPKELYTTLKIRCAYNGISMQDYISQLLHKDMESHSGKKRSILIVDDEEIMRDSLKDWLHENYGYNIVAVETGEEAIDLVKKQDFDTIVLDVRLAGKTGIEVLKEIKAIKPQIKCIITTAYPQIDLAVEAIKAGALDYLVKPFAPSELERLI